MSLYFLVFLFVLRLFSYKELKEETESEIIRNGTTNSFSTSMQQRAPESTLILNTFREKVNDALYKEYMKSDVYLMRWLSVNDFKLDKAETMLRKALEWRQANNIDSIVGEVLIEQKLSPFIFPGDDYEGSAVIVFRTVIWDVRRHILEGKRDMAARWLTQFFENVEIAVLTNSGIIGNHTKTGSAADKATWIIDMYGYNMKQHACVDCFNVYFELMGVLENYYPGYMKHFIFIHAPRIFRPLLEMLKPLMSQGTKEVLQVFASNKAEWEKVISKIMPIEVFYSAYKTPE